jgi:hypothetical protein
MPLLPYLKFHGIQVWLNCCRQLRSYQTKCCSTSSHICLTVRSAAWHVSARNGGWLHMIHVSGEMCLCVLKFQDYMLDHLSFCLGSSGLLNITLICYSSCIDYWQNCNKLFKKFLGMWYHIVWWKFTGIPNEYWLSLQD